MNNKRAKSAKSKFSKLYRKIHRTIGVWLAFFVLFLSVTGILINHTERFKLDKTFVEVDWILDLYGIDAPQKLVSFNTAVDQALIVQMDQQVWFADNYLFHYAPELVSAGQFQNFLVFAGANDLFIYTIDGQLLDRFTKTTGLPGTVKFVRAHGQQLTIGTDQGVFSMDEEFMEFLPLPNYGENDSAGLFVNSSVQDPKAWHPKTENLSYEMKEHLVANFKHRIIKWERALLDMHSGRLFSSLGVWFMDLVAVFFILLSLTGLYLWQKDKSKSRKRK